MSTSGRRVALVAVLAVLIVAAGVTLAPATFLRSYLFAFLFCLGLSLGGLANLMLHEVTGGRWGVALREPWMAAARLVPFNALLFVPLIFGLPLIYHWIGSSAPEMKAKHWWLNEPFFLARAAVYFLLWGLFAWRWLSIAARATQTRPASLRRWSAVGLIVYGLTISLASVDWIMSLMPQWYSTTFGLLIATSQMLSGMALGVAACAVARPRVTEPERFQDFGNLLLMYVMSWAYLAFTQYLIIWAEDLPKETVWYVPRVQTSWRWLSLIVLVLQFALPFALLLLRVAKRTPRYLGPIAWGILVAQLLYDFYLVAPAFRPAGLQVTWSDPLTAIVVIGLWVVAWRYLLDEARRTAPPARSEGA